MVYWSWKKVNIINSGDLLSTVLYLMAWVAPLPYILFVSLMKSKYGAVAEAVGASSVEQLSLSPFQLESQLHNPACMMW